ncbi:hypothetical protein D3C76_160350 [compost metagenome]
MTSIINELAQPHRDALVAYYLGQVVPNHPTPGARRLVTPEDLYEFLLIDNQVNAKVDTSRVAMGIASIQQYIHAIYNGMEPGYQGVFDTQQQRLWRQSMSEYAVWAGNQMLQDYPENYLEPTLRLKQTQGFEALINDISQSRISKDTVQKALLHYLGKFEQVSNLNMVSGYIDGTDFRRADYYFIGQQNVEPHQYFWRKAQVRFRDPGDKSPGDDYLSPTAWSEWLPIEIPNGNEVLHIRPLVIEGRLYVAWIDHQYVQPPAVKKDTDQIPEYYANQSRYNLNLAYRSMEGSWSAPMVTALKEDRTRGGLGRDFFIAYVSESDPRDKKIVFAYGNNDIDKPDYEGVIFDARFNTLFHKQVNHTETSGDYGKMLNALQHFSSSGNNLQYPLSNDVYSHPQVRDNPVGKHAVEGPFSSSIGLTTWFCIDDQGNYCLRSYGVVHGTRLAADGQPVPVTLTLSYYSPGENNPGTTKTFPVILNGSARTPDLIHVFGKTPDKIKKDMVVQARIDTAPYTTSKHFEISLRDLPAAVPALIAKTVESDVPDRYLPGQFLDLTSLKLTGLKYVRLNTLFAPELVKRATISLDALLHWDTQNMAEPPPPDGSAGTSYPMDFHGANGRYFWELFFHIPHAIAYRLHEEFDYLEAEQWLHYLFNPQERIKPTNPPSPSYWSVRPLDEQSVGDYEVEGITDPDAISYAKPIHYRKAIFTFYIRNLIAYGDLLYRRLTRDSLNEAKLVYVRALSLLGPRPDNRMIGRWEPVTLATAAEVDRNTLAAVEAAQLPVSMPCGVTCERPWLDLLDSTRFRLPINTHLLGLWGDLQQRLDNLRDNLTLDGKPLLLPLYAPQADPRDLLRAQSAGSGLLQRGVGSLAAVPPFRFRAMLPRLQNAVETLSRFGEQVRQYRELKDRAMQEELQHSHVLELSQFGIRLQEEAIVQANAGLLALESSKAVIGRRRDHYAALEAENISGVEKTVMNLKLAASITGAAEGILQATAGAVHMASVIVTAVGGGHTRAGAAVSAAAGGLGTYKAGLQIVADRLDISEQYRRRAAEWAFQRDQASAEVEAIDQQLIVQRKTVDMARLQLQQANKAEQQAQDQYRFLKTRSTHAGLYQWLLGQLSTFYFQAYDAVVALCLSGEACWQYEMGDYQSRFIQPNVWFDNYFGLTAGEALKLQLLRMESAYLKRFERRLELVKTISLKALFEQEGTGEWERKLQAIRTGGKLDFDLPSSLFDSDYPGHYLRQLVSVSVSLPVVVGPYQDIRALLTQVSSKTVLKPDKRAMNELYEQDDRDSRNILFNPRASQSIGLSSGMNDHGLFQLDFNDERYLPFEGTGAVSSWQLKFPRHDKTPQQGMLETLNDVIVHVRYTALEGGAQFASDVESLLALADQRRWPIVEDATR